MKILARRLAVALATAGLLIGCSGGSGLTQGVPKDAPVVTGPAEGKSKEMETLLKAKPKKQSAVKSL